jgi:hypothetical protein
MGVCLSPMRLQPHLWEVANEVIMESSRKRSSQAGERRAEGYDKIPISRTSRASCVTTQHCSPLPEPIPHLLVLHHDTSPTILYSTTDQVHEHRQCHETKGIEARVSNIEPSNRHQLAPELQRGLGHTPDLREFPRKP